MLFVECERSLGSVSAGGWHLMDCTQHCPVLAANGEKVSWTAHSTVQCLQLTARRSHGLHTALSSACS